MHLKFNLAILAFIFSIFFSAGVSACKCRNDDWSVDWYALLPCSPYPTFLPSRLPTGIDDAGEC